MSYYISLDVTLKAENRILLEKALSFWQSDFGIDNEGNITEEGCFEVTFGVYRSWPSYLEDIKNFSELFPAVTIYGEGSGDEPGDLFRLVAKGGKVVEKLATIIYPKFKELEERIMAIEEEILFTEGCL